MYTPLISAIVSLYILSLFLPNISYQNWVILIIAGVTLTLVQVIVKPILKLLLLPITIITLGLFSGVINVVVLWLVMALVPGFHIDPMSVFGLQLSYFFTLVVVSFLLSLLQSLLLKFLRRFFG